MAEITKAQEKAIQDYEKTLEGWLGDISKEDIAKVLEKLGEWDKMPYARLIKLYLDLCSNCGACANECHIYKVNPKKQFNPAHRAKLVRSVYQRHFTLPGKIFMTMISTTQHGITQLTSVSKA